MPPAIAVLGPIMREREDVVGGLANCVQDAAVLDREGLGELLGRGTRQATTCPGYLGRTTPGVESFGDASGQPCAIR